MVGLQYATIMTALGPKLNGIVNYDFWVPEPTLNFEGVEAFLKKYQAAAKGKGVDPLGYYLPTYAHAYLEVLGQAVKATNSIDHGKLAEHMRKTTYDTVVGKVKFAPERRMGQDPDADGPVPGHQGQQARDLREGGDPRGPLSQGVGFGEDPLPLYRSQIEPNGRGGR